MRRAYLLMACVLLFGLMGCGKEEVTTEAITQEQTEEVMQTATEETAEATEEMTTEAAVTDTSQGEETTGLLTPEQAQELIVQTFGDVDEATGNTYSFSHVNTMTVNDEEYHVFVWSWLVDDHVSHLTDLFVKTDGSAIYEGMFVGDGVTIYTETNHLK